MAQSISQMVVLTIRQYLTLYYILLSPWCPLFLLFLLTFLYLFLPLLLCPHLYFVIFPPLSTLVQFTSIYLRERSTNSLDISVLGFYIFLFQSLLIHLVIFGKKRKRKQSLVCDLFLLFDTFCGKNILSVYC